jgi:hypothetical protein
MLMAKADAAGDSSEACGWSTDLFQIRLPDELRRRIKTQAKRKGITMSAYMRMGISRQLDEDEAEQRRGRDSRAA